MYDINHGHIEWIAFLFADDRLEADAGRPGADPHHDVGVVDGATLLVHRAEHHRLVAQLLADLQQRFKEWWLVIARNSLNPSACSCLGSNIFSEAASRQDVFLAQASKEGTLQLCTGILARNLTLNAMAR